MGPLDLLTPQAPTRFGGPPPRNAYVELHNVIAAAESVADFGPADRVRISRRHQVDLALEFGAERRALYAGLLDDRLANADLDAEDRHVLGHVAQTLALGPADLQAAHERAFGVAVTRAVADDCLSVEERLLLYKLQHLLGLDPDLADAAYDVLARDRFLKRVAQALCDGALSPDEDAEIERARQALSLRVPADLGRMLDHARDRWRLRHGEIPTADVELELADGETGRFRGRADWSEIRTDRFERRVGSHALQSGQTGGLEVPAHVLRGPRRRGDVVLTDRRVILRPDSGLPDEIRVDRLFQILRFRNGTVLRTRAERRLFVDPGERNEVFYAVLHHTLFGQPSGSRADRAGPARPGPARRPRVPEAPRLVATGARWSKVLTAEVGGAERHWVLKPSRRTVLQRLANEEDWPGHGSVRVSDEHLILDGADRNRASRTTIQAVERSGVLVLVRRRQAHDWIVRCRTAAEAEALVAALA